MGQHRRGGAGSPCEAGAPLDLDWVPDELQNLLFLAERAGMIATARDLRYAIRSAEVELRREASPLRRVEGGGS